VYFSAISIPAKASKV